MDGWKKVGDVDARRSAGGLMLPWSSVFVVRLTPSYLLQYIAVAAPPPPPAAHHCCFGAHGSLTGSSQRRLVFIVAATKLLLLLAAAAVTAPAASIRSPIKWESLQSFQCFKVHTFWEGHIFFQNLHRIYVLCSQIYSGDFEKFCSLLREPEL